ncbi:ABC transporter permease [Terrimonas sp. NA20]|uniref:ABC transporter permease n=1 Tax=Terrimonas ginsenosidimutans TaxID=2908004 RepID=A0ABS9KXW1_9BACT|nr:ABC transporter permease [Terrimonas ginsenosidimutans]MCG2617155.1 ABC transporter permease [Terrimonas ginsenosidimutans]
MFRSYLKTAFRSLWKNKGFSLINIAGLGAGIAVCLIIFTILQFELGFDGFHKNKDRIFRVISEREQSGDIRRSPGAPYPMPGILKQEMPGVISSGVFQETNVQIIIDDEQGRPVKRFREEGSVFCVEPSFFEIFDFAVEAGDYHSLADPNTALLSKEVADRFFGDWRTATGKTFRKNGQVIKVAGIMKDLPVNTDLRSGIFVSYSSQKWLSTSDDWHSTASNHNCYLLLPEGTKSADISLKLTALLAKHSDDKKKGDAQALQPVTDVHYNGEISNYTGRAVTGQLVNTLSLIAGFILLIACVNFVNLSTAQAFNRSKEVGVRKVLGGSKFQIRSQFYGETFLLAACATILAGLITIPALPAIGGLLDLPLDNSLLLKPSVLLALAGMLALVVALAGFYPAIVLSRYNPITALKGKLTRKASGGVAVRRGLVVFQFVVAQVLIIGMVVIVQQMSFFQKHDMGFDKEAIVNLSIPSDSASMSKMDFLRSKVKSINGVKEVSFSFASPADNGNWSSNFRFDHAAEETEWFANLKWADHDFLNAYDIKLIAGRNLYPSDTVAEFLVNETFVKQLGITDVRQVLNKEISIWDAMKGNVVGVVKDFNALSLRSGFVPVVISTNKTNYRKAGIKLQTADMGTALTSLRQLWTATFPDFVFQEQFLDEKVANFYAQEQRLSGLYKIFAALAMFLSCLGLYGLVSFMAIQRVKEVGIRKVLGASSLKIVLLFSKEFLILIGIAFVIAAPLAVYFMNKWLKEFAYQIDISWEIIMLAGISAAVIALLTISVKAIRAALANPVRSLRSE